MNSDTKVTDGPYLLGVDIGTLSTKGILTDARGTVVARVASDHGVTHPQPGWMEQDPERDWWGSFVGVVRELLEGAGKPPAQVAAICVSGLFPALCVADRNGRPVRPAILYADSRATQEIREAESIVGAHLKGDEISPKLLWLRQNEPEVLRQAHTIFGAPHSYVVHRLTGERVIDHYTAYRLGGVVDDSRERWRPEVCRDLGIAEGMLPRIARPSALAGRVGREAAARTGLAEGMPVLVGTADSFVTLLGSGVIRRGDAIAYYGTTGWLGVLTRDLEDVIDQPHLIDDVTPYVLSAYILASGGALKWYLHEFGPADGGDASEPALYSALDDLARETEPGASGLVILPHFSGRILPTPDPLARGVVFGLTLSHGRAHFWRALQEMIGYSFREGLEAVGQLGIQARRIVATGGGARSQFLREVVTNILGLPQEYVRDDMASLGNAFLAARGMGLVDSFGAMTRDWMQTEGVTYPCAEYGPVYEKLYAVYRRLNESMGDSYDLLAAAIGNPDGRPDQVHVTGAGGLRT